MAEKIWVARLKVSRATAHKLSTVHGLQAAEIRDAVEGVRNLPAKWNDDPKRGRRAFVQTFVRGQKILVVLYPANDPVGDAYHLGSAYRIP
jgi:hypothetical protein